MLFIVSEVCANVVVSVVDKIVEENVVVVVCGIGVNNVEAS